MTTPTSSDTTSSFSDPLPSLAHMLREQVPELAEHRLFIDMFMPGGVMEFPYAAKGATQRLDSREAMQAYFDQISDLMLISPMRDVRSHRGAIDTVVLEFACDGVIAASGQPFHQRYISAITLQEGRIALYRDYWNPLVLTKALDGASA